MQILSMLSRRFLITSPLCVCGLLAWSAAAQTPPSNDSFTNAAVINGPVAAITASNVGATKEPGEPNHAGNPGGASVWWSWMTPTNGQVTIDTLGSSFDTLLAVYRGSSFASLYTVAKDDDWDGFSASRVTFDARAGLNYLIAVDGFNGTAGHVLLTVRMGPVPPLITNQPQTQMAAPGMSVAFTVSAAGSPPLYYQWFKAAGAIVGATGSRYTRSSIQATNAGSYAVVVSNAVGSATSSNAVLAVNDIVITNQPGNLTLAAGYDATFNVGAAGSVPLAYQWRKGGVDIPTAKGTTYCITNVQSTNQGAFDVVVTGSGNRTSSVATLSVICPYTFVTFAGMSRTAGTNDGPGAAARFCWPHGIAVDTGGDVYVTDMGNHTIRKVRPDGFVTTVAGTPGLSGSNDGPASVASFNQPWALTVDGATNIYVADTCNQTIRKIASDGTVTTLAGLPGVPGFADGTNGAARFDAPSGLAMNHDGELYMSDYSSHTIRKLTPTSTNWIVTTVAGSPRNYGFADGKGSVSFCPSSTPLPGNNTFGAIRANGPMPHKQLEF